MKLWHLSEEQSLRERLLEGTPGGEQQQHPGDKWNFKLLQRTNTRGRSQPQLLTYLAGKNFQLLWVTLKTTAR